MDEAGKLLLNYFNWPTRQVTHNSPASKSKLKHKTLTFQRRRKAICSSDGRHVEQKFTLPLNSAPDFSQAVDVLDFDAIILVIIIITIGLNGFDVV